MNLKTRALIKTIQLLVLAIASGFCFTYALSMIPVKLLGIVAMSTFVVLCGYVLYLNILSQMQCKEQESCCEKVDK